ncbi:MAG: GNAT family N-acetyltransferase [Deinococcales bacterium]
MEAYRMLLLSEEGTKEAVYMRLAEFRDMEKLIKLYEEAWDSDECETMEGWLEQGGAMLIEHSNGRLLAALRWQEQVGGEGVWQLDPIATLPKYRSQGFGRWLITKVEALAIEQNVPQLRLELEKNADLTTLLPYYQRLGYLQNEENQQKISLSKAVGGMWQLQS